MEQVDLAPSKTWEPDAKAWQAMCSNPNKYAPLIERVVGFMLFIGYRDDEDAADRLCLGFDEFASQTPFLAGLSPDEVYFVQVGASSMIFREDPGLFILRDATAWMRDGGPEC